jgi:hypothetical protein
MDCRTKLVYIGKGIKKEILSPIKRSSIQQNCFPIGGMLGGNVLFILWGLCA